TSFRNPISNPTLNLLTRPSNLAPGSTIYVVDTASLSNTGNNAHWVPFDSFFKGISTVPGSVAPGTTTVTGAVSDPVNVDNVHRIVTFVDPLTGKSRVTVTTDSGVYTAV